MRRWWRPAAPVRDPGAELPGARVLAVSHDETAASSAVLAGAGVAGEGELLLRHLVFVDPAAAGAVLERFAPDGYVAGPALPSDPPAPAGTVPVVFARFLRVTAVSAAQERSVVSSVTARLGGTVGGWAVLEAAGAVEPGDGSGGKVGRSRRRR